MSRLKSQIKQTEAELENNDIYMKKQYHAFAENPNTGKFMACAMTGGLLIGYLVGRSSKMSFNTVARVTQQLEKIVATYKLFS